MCDEVLESSSANYLASSDSVWVSNSLHDFVSWTFLFTPRDVERSKLSTGRAPSDLEELLILSVCEVVFTDTRMSLCTWV